MNIKNKTLSLLFSFFLFILILIPAINTADATPSAKQQRFYLLLGQSNMAGEGKVSQLAGNFKRLPKNVMLYQHGKLVKISHLHKFGPEIAFAHSIARKYPNALIHLVKFAPGGSLMRDWTIRAKGKHYDTLIKQVKRSNQGQIPKINGVLWVHGERDSKSVQLARYYKRDMLRFIQMLQHDFHNNRLPFAIARISVPEAFRPAVPNIRAVQEQLARSSPYIRMISTDDLSKIRDQVHFDNKGQLELGKRFAQGM